MWQRCQKQNLENNIYNRWLWGKSLRRVEPDCYLSWCTKIIENGSEVLLQGLALWNVRGQHRSTDGGQARVFREDPVVQDIIPTADKGNCIRRKSSPQQRRQSSEEAGLRSRRNSSGCASDRGLISRIHFKNKKPNNPINRWGNEQTGLRWRTYHQQIPKKVFSILSCQGEAVTNAFEDVGKGTHTHCWRNGIVGHCGSQCGSSLKTKTRNTIWPAIYTTCK